MMADEQTMPVFKPMRRRRMLLGLGLKEWMRVATSLLLGAFLALSLGGWTHTADIPLTATDLQEEYGRLSAAQAALQKSERLMASLGIDDVRAMDLTSEERALASEALSLGITSDMGRDEITELIPKTREQTVPVIPDIPRWMLCLGLPLALSVLMSVEVSHNTNLSKEAKRLIAHLRSQRVYTSMPKAYARKES